MGSECLSVLTVHGVGESTITITPMARRNYIFPTQVFFVASCFGINSTGHKARAYEAANFAARRISVRGFVANFIVDLIKCCVREADDQMIIASLLEVHHHIIVVVRHPRHQLLR